jgi:hypothetical protein
MGKVGPVNFDPHNATDSGGELVTLHRLDVEYLTHLLDRVEDWLRHAGDDARDDLAEFLNQPGNGRLAAAGLITSLSQHTAALHRQLKETTS